MSRDFKVGVTVNGLNVLDDVATFSKSGTLAVAVGKGRWRFPFAATLLGVTAAVDSAPTGAALVLDVNKNGTTVFTTQGNRPSVAAGSNTTASEALPDVTSVAAGDYLSVDVDQVGSTAAGSDLVVQVRYRRGVAQVAGGAALDDGAAADGQTASYDNGQASDSVFAGSFDGGGA